MTLSRSFPAAWPFSSAAAIAVLVIGIAFVVAPRACNGGLEVYFVSGIVSLLVLVALPFVAALGRCLALRFVWAFGFAAFGVLAWLVGLFAANVRFICGLGYL